jgi:putative aldouronate transport system permease protein
MEGIMAEKTTGKKIKESTSYIVFKWVNTVIMIIICAATLYPFLYLVAQSFSSEEAITLGKVNLFPIGFNLETYKSVFAKGEFMHSYKNTVIYAVL